MLDPKTTPAQDLAMVIAHLSGAPTREGGFCEINRDGTIELLTEIKRKLEEEES